MNKRVEDLDQWRIRGGGAGGGSHPDPEIRVGGGLKKIFRPFGPQFDLKIKKNKGGGPPRPRPSPGSFTVDKGGLAFSTITDLFGKSRVSLFSVAFISGRPTKAFHR